MAGNIVLGATLALEDKEGITSLDAVQNIKVSLMGPLAGIGDTLFWTLLPTIMGSSQDIWLWKATLSVLSCGSL